MQWALAYIAFAFALLQGMDVVAHQFGWPDGLQRGVTLALMVGFFVVVVLAWYHGERGAQKVSGTEIVILALLLAIGGGLLWRFERAGSTSSPDAAQRNPEAVAAAPALSIPAKSVAVLPFANLSGDPKQVYFSDGVTEEVLNALAQLPNLKVAARTSAFTFKSNASDVHEVGRVLGVATVLEGSIQKSGDEVRITVQLVDTRSGYQLWSENYDRKLNNIFAVEDEISNAVADKLRVQWNSAQPLVAQKTVDPRAHDFYLRGLTLLAARGPGLRNAVAYFQQAVSIDPGF
ncbi:MAG TPA: hypothetical protein VFK31_11915, partial [Rhodanobacteraceae bacterium]|nr:hypothetical protein [Rhodanobacteraceae bacterium]